MVSFMHEQNIICSQTQSQTQLEDIAHDQTIIWRELFAGQVVGSQPMKRKKNLHRMIKRVIGIERKNKVFWNVTLVK